MVEFGECVDETFGGSPKNVYHHDCSADSAIASGPSSRRNSNNPFGEFKEFVKRRRNLNGRKFSLNDGYVCNAVDTSCQKLRVTSKFRTNQTSCDSGVRKVSADSQFFEDSDDEPQLRNRRLADIVSHCCQRCFHRWQRKNHTLNGALMKGVKTLLWQKNDEKFRIMRYCDHRKRKDTKLSQHLFLRALDRYSDPYKQYMQNILCYDLAPSHGAVVLVDSGLSVHKALIALSQAANNAALIVNPSASEILGIITITDCLRAIVVAVKEDPFVGHRSVKDFLKKYNGRRRLVTASAHLSVWDAARLFCLNHVHRIPILQVNEFSRETDVLYLLSLRTVFSETILNLVESNGLKAREHSLAPHIKNRTLEQARIGTWEKFVSVPSKAHCGKAIDLLLETKLSCIGVLDDEGRLVGSINKSDIMRLASLHERNYLDILTLPVKEVYSTPPSAHVHNTVYEAITILMESDQQCLFVIDVITERPVAAIAFVDIMDYILNSSEIHHKMSFG